MARKVDQVRPRVVREEVIAERELAALNNRAAMRLLEHAAPDDPPRRLNGSGWVVICAVVVSAAFYALGTLLAHLGGHP